MLVTQDPEQKLVRRFQAEDLAGLSAPFPAASRFSAVRSTLPALSGISDKNSTSSGAL
jgi:hypothetical protein